MEGIALPRSIYAIENRLSIEDRLERGAVASSCAMAENPISAIATNVVQIVIRFIRSPF